MNLNIVIETVLELNVDQRRELIVVLQESLPALEVLNAPSLGIQHTKQGKYWDYEQLQTDFKEVNPGVTVTKEAIQFTFKRKKLTVKSIVALFTEAARVPTPDNSGRSI